MEKKKIISSRIKKLNLGCGRVKRKEYVNVDTNPSCFPDIIHDLNNFPYPFSANEFDKIDLDHVIEHLDNPLKVLQEVYRIAKDNAIVTVKCPHFSCNWLNPGHKSAISLALFDFLEKDNVEAGGNANYQLEKVQLYWIRNRKDYLEKRPILVKFLNRIINFLANLHLGAAERVWCYWVGGFEETYFRVRVIKN